MQHQLHGPNVQLHVKLKKNRKVIPLLICLKGMEDASCDKTEYLINYLSNIDDIILFPGSLGRIRSRYTNNPRCKYILDVNIYF